MIDQYKICLCNKKFKVQIKFWGRGGYPLPAYATELQSNVIKACAIIDIFSLFQT